MNPVPLMRLVELTKGQHTSEQTFEACKGLAEFMGKEVATSQDRPVRAVKMCSDLNTLCSPVDTRMALLCNVVTSALL